MYNFSRYFTPRNPTPTDMPLRASGKRIIKFLEKKPKIFAEVENIT